MTENKEIPDFHTPGWISMVVNVTPISQRDEKWFLSKFASRIQ